MEEKQEGSRKISKKLKIAAIIAGAVIIFLVTAFYGFSWYGEWSLQKDVAQIIKQQNLPFLEDTYGGKTPKETLDLFITAVEKGDFTLASKYFVLSEQKKWEERLKNGKLNNNIGRFLTDLKRENEVLDYTDPTALLGNRQLYTVGGEMLITFIKYPSSIWKIQEL